MFSRSLAWFALLVLAPPARAAAAQLLEPDAHVFLQRSAPDRFGSCVAGLGDVNADGVLDLAVSAPDDDGAGGLQRGRVYALSGVDASTLWSRPGAIDQTNLGAAMEVMDWNSDGVLDVVAGEPGAPFAGGPTEGRVVIFSGAGGVTLATLLGPGPSSGFGAYLATGGDLNGDGVEDLLVSAPNFGAGGTLQGRIQAFTRGSTVAFTSLDGAFLDTLGTGLAFVGDVDTPPDGRDEFVAGRRNAGGFSGQALVLGWNGAQVSLRYPVADVGFAGGIRLHGGRDLDGDLVPDFAIGDLGASRVRLRSGADGALLRTLDGEGGGGSFGSVHLIGDVDGDGGADVAVGAYENASGATNGGKVFLYSGASGALLKTFTELQPNKRFGYDVRELGDLNGDGKLDLVVGAYGDPSDRPFGAVLVVSAHLAAPANASYPAALPTDPILADSGGDPTAGPIVGSPLEVFDLALDCSGAPAGGPYAMAGFLGLRANPFPTPYGSLWISGNQLFLFTGTHAQDVVECVPGGLVLPNSATLIGRSYTCQGFCGGRISNALRQTIGG